MPNKVEPGMRFRGSNTNTGYVYKAMRPAPEFAPGWWHALCETTGREELSNLTGSHYEPVPGCALGCNARTYNPICNAHAPKLANTNYGGWQGSNDEITWCAVPNREAANFYRYQRKVLVTSVQPIPEPEPAPELCAPPGYKPCGRVKDGCKRWAKDANACRLCTYGDGYEVMAAQFGHDWVPPQAKPVLREPKPLSDGDPDICLVCFGDKHGNKWACPECAQSRDIYSVAEAWEARQAQPAAKDIPSNTTGAVGAVRLPTASDTRNTEAARGGEAAISKRGPCGRLCGQVMVESECPQHGFESRLPSAVAAAPAIEPWRPTVDDLHWIPDAVDGWRR